MLIVVRKEKSKRRRQTPMEDSLTVPQHPFALEKSLVEVGMV